MSLRDKILYFFNMSTNMPSNKESNSFNESSRDSCVKTHETESKNPDFKIDSLGRTRPKRYAVAPRAREHLKNAKRFVFTIEGRSELIEERVTIFINSFDCELGVYAREGGRNMIHPHYQGYIEL